MSSTSIQSPGLTQNAGTIVIASGSCCITVTQFGDRNNPFSIHGGTLEILMDDPDSLLDGKMLLEYLPSRLSLADYLSEISFEDLLSRHSRRLPLDHEVFDPEGTRRNLLSILDRRLTQEEITFEDFGSARRGIESADITGMVSVARLVKDSHIRKSWLPGITRRGRSLCDVLGIYSDIPYAFMLHPELQAFRDIHWPEFQKEISEIGDDIARDPSLDGDIDVNIASAQGFILDYIAFRDSGGEIHEVNPRGYSHDLGLRSRYIRENCHYLNGVSPSRQWHEGGSHYLGTALERIRDEGDSSFLDNMPENKKDLITYACQQYLINKYGDVVRVPRRLVTAAQEAGV